MKGLTVQVWLTTDTTGHPNPHQHTTAGGWMNDTHKRACQENNQSLAVSETCSPLLLLGELVLWWVLEDEGVDLVAHVHVRDKPARDKHQHVEGPGSNLVSCRV